MAEFVHLIFAEAADPESLRDEWVNTAHIQTVQHYLTDEPPGGLLLWLELTLAGGDRRFLPVGPATAVDAVQVAQRAIDTLLIAGSGPVVAWRGEQPAGDPGVTR